MQFDGGVPLSEMKERGERDAGAKQKEAS